MSDVGGDVSTLVVRAGTDLSKEAVKLANEAMKQLLLLLIQKAKEQSNKAGEIALRKLVKSNADIKMFDLEQKQLKAFHKHAKKHHITYAMIEDRERFSVFYKQADEHRVKSVLEKLVEQGLSKTEDNIPGTKMDAKEQERNDGRKALAERVGKPENDISTETREQGERLSLAERRQEIKPLLAAQQQAPPVKNKNRDRGGR